MPLLNVVVTLVLVAAALWLINRKLTMASNVRMILNVVVVVAFGLWMLQAMQLMGPAVR
jgi:hypothetical protein